MENGKDLDFVRAVEDLAKQYKIQNYFLLDGDNSHSITQNNNCPQVKVCREALVAYCEANVDGYDRYHDWRDDLKK